MVNIFSRRKFDIDGKHVFITGGSAGLGLAFAKYCAANGAMVTITARNVEKLEEASVEIEKVSKNKNAVHYFSCDVKKYDELENFVKEANKKQGRTTDLVVCNAGYSLPGYCIDQDVSIYRDMMETNYMGVVHTVKACLPQMIESNNKGSFVIVSSACALVSFIGYSQYCPSKYAVKGFSEALRNELKIYGMNVHIFYPSNMDTPGFEKENLTKPEETRIIEGTASTITADEAAFALVEGLRKKKYAITNDMVCEITRMATNGIAPRSSPLLELILSPFLYLIQFGFLKYIDYVVTTKQKHN